MPVERARSFEDRRQKANWEDRIIDLTDMMRGWIWATDREHRFTYMSNSVLTFAGRPPSWHYGKTRDELGNQPHNDEHYRTFLRLTADRLPFGPLEFCRAQNGGTVWMRTIGQPVFDDHGAFSGYYGAAYEISSEMTEREAQKESMAILAEQNHHMQSAVDSLSCGISVYDRQLHLRFANANYYETLDLDRSRFPSGTSLSVILRHLERCGEFFGAKADETVKYKLQKVAERTLHTFQRTRRNGRRLEITCMPLSCGGHLRIYSDTTERVEERWKLGKAVRDLNDRNRDLEQARNLVAILRRAASQSEN